MRRTTRLKEGSQLSFQVEVNGAGRRRRRDFFERPSAAGRAWMHSEAEKGYL